MRLAIRHAAAVFATLLVVDVVACAAWWFGMRLTPRLSSIGQGDLAPLVVAWTGVLVAAVFAVAAGLARAIVKPDVEEGRSFAVDVLARPAAVAAVAAPAGAALRLADGGSAQDAAVVAAVFGVLALVALALVALVVRRVSWRALAVTAAVVVATALVAQVVADRAGRARLEQQRADALREVATWRQQQQAATRPVLREPGLEANAVDAYRPLLEAQRARIDLSGNFLGDLGKSVGSPGTPLAPSVAAALERSRADIAALREATRSRRAVWPFEYEKSFSAEIPYLLGVRVLAQLALLEGHERASAGDVAGAAETYLDVLRFGTDFGDGPLIMTLIGTAVERMAVEALARLVRSPRGGAVLDRVDAGVALLQPALLDIGPAWRSERLSFAALGPTDDGREFASLIGVLTDSVSAPLPPRLVPWNAYTASAVEAANRTFRDLEAAAAKGDPRARKEIEDHFLERYYFATPNFIYRTLIPSILRAHISVDEARVMAAAVRTAVSLEKRRAKEGRYPADPGVLPVDLIAADGTPLHYRVAADGASYALWSVGGDRKDDGGKVPGDSALPEAGWPAAAGAAETAVGVPKK